MIDERTWRHAVRLSLQDNRTFWFGARCAANTGDQFGRELWLAVWMVAICWEEEAHTALVHSTLRDESCSICGEVRVGPTVDDKNKCDACGYVFNYDLDVPRVMLITGRVLCERCAREGRR